MMLQTPACFCDLPSFLCILVFFFSLGDLYEFPLFFFFHRLDDGCFFDS